MPRPAKAQPPVGYEEIGEGLARAVAEGDRPQAWANELAVLAGYRAARAKQWTDYYRATHEAQLRTLQRRRQEKSGKIERLRNKSIELRQKLRDSFKPE